jgi:hypothetical protein
MKIQQKTIYNIYGYIKYYNTSIRVKRSDYNKQIAINKLLSDFPTINKNDIIINKGIETIYNYR